jgi:PAS domain S-box-containing protein
MEAAHSRVRAAGGDDRVAELERSQRRFQHLYEISKLLARFQTLERTVPEVVTLISDTLSLRGAIFILETGGVPRTITWQAVGEGTQRLQAAKAHAQEAYSYLTHSRVDLEYEEARVLEVARLPESATETQTEAKNSFVMLPFAVGHGSIFGALQIEGAGELEELDLSFIDAVVSQLAVALDRHSTDRALRASATRLAGIISIATDAIISIDEAQRVVMYNEGAQRIFGWSRDEILGKPHDILLPERFRGVHRKYIGSFATGFETARGMGDPRPGIFGLRKNGQEFPAEAAVSKLNVGGAWLFTVVLRDITERKRAEHEEEFLAEIGAIFASTLDSRMTLTNVACAAMREFADFCLIEFADEHGEIRRLEVVSSDPAKAEIAAALKRLPLDRNRPHLSQAILESKRSQMISYVSPEVIRAIAQSDEHRRLLEAIAPTSIMGVPLNVHGRLLGALVVASCRTGRHYATADLRLLKEVGRRAALALENARLYHAAERAIQARDDVLGIVAHDIRNPLSTIIMQVTLMRRSQGRPDRIERAATRISRLIQDLLDVTHMDAGRLSIEPARVPAGQVLLESVEAQESLAASNSIELRPDVTAELPELWADRDRLLQVFENLISNAVRFTGRGGRITVGARPREEDVLFWVADTGIGISGDDLPHVFDRFWRVRKAERRGAGLGLAIVKGLIEAHGGHVWVDSVPSRGSTFYLTVPLARPA